MRQRWTHSTMTERNRLLEFTRQYMDQLRERTLQSRNKIKSKPIKGKGKGTGKGSSGCSTSSDHA